MRPENDRTWLRILACPVDVQPGTDGATPPDWDWRVIGTSQPNAATFPYQPQRCWPGAGRRPDNFRFAARRPVRGIHGHPGYHTGQHWTFIGPGSPALSCLWKGRGYRCADETIDGSKQALARDLAAQLRLLLLLATSRQGRIAPQLRSNLEYLQSVLHPREVEPPEQA